MKESKPIFARIPLEWDKALEDIAEDECRTKASVVKQAIKEFLKKKRK